MPQKSRRLNATEFRNAQPSGGSCKPLLDSGRYRSEAVYKLDKGFVKVISFGGPPFSNVGTLAEVPKKGFIAAPCFVRNDAFAMLKERVFNSSEGRSREESELNTLAWRKIIRIRQDLRPSGGKI